MPRISANLIGGPNVAAFLDMLAVSEIGIPLLHASDDGYNVIVGSTASNPTLFPSYAKHPNVRIFIPRIKDYSTAAGRYQLLNRYYEAYRKSMKLVDFRPESQDRIAVQQIRERKALDDIVAGRFDVAVSKCRNIWASLPGAGYGQHENNLEALAVAFRQKGGFIA